MDNWNYRSDVTDEIAHRSDITDEIAKGIFSIFV